MSYSGPGYLASFGTTLTVTPMQSLAVTMPARRRSIGCPAPNVSSWLATSATGVSMMLSTDGRSVTNAQYRVPIVVRRAARQGDLHHQALRLLEGRLVGMLHGWPRHPDICDDDTYWAHRRSTRDTKAAQQDSYLGCLHGWEPLAHSHFYHSSGCPPRQAAGSPYGNHR